MSLDMRLFAFREVPQGKLMMEKIKFVENIQHTR